MAVKGSMRPEVLAAKRRSLKDFLRTDYFFNDLGNVSDYGKTIIKKGIRKWKKIFAVIGWLILIVLIILSLASCSPAKRLERLHKNNPYLFTNIKDTIPIKDTIKVKIPGTSIDTSFHINRLIDTIVLEKNNIKTIIYRKQGTDTIFVNTIVKEQTLKVPYEKQVAVNRYEYKEQKNNLSMSIVKTFISIGLAVFFIVLLVYTLKD